MPSSRENLLRILQQALGEYYLVYDEGAINRLVQALTPLERLLSSVLVPDDLIQFQPLIEAVRLKPVEIEGESAPRVAELIIARVMQEVDAKVFARFKARAETEGAITSRQVQEVLAGKEFKQLFEWVRLQI